MNQGLVTNDRFDPARAGSEETLRSLSDAARARSTGVSIRTRPRRSLSARPEGRWSRLHGSACDSEVRALAWIGVLLERYGILTREIVAIEPLAPSWSEVAPLSVTVGMEGRAPPRLFCRRPLGRAVRNVRRCN